MTDHIIAYRLKDGQVQFVLDTEGDVGIFTSLRHAEHYLEHNRLHQSGQGKFQILELDEL